jgi:hypothetical protein
MSLRTCRRCGLDLPLERFAFSDRAALARHPWCRTCYGVYQRQYRQRRKANDGARLTSPTTATICRFPGCEKPIHRESGARAGLCWAHHRGMRQAKNPLCAVAGCQRQATSSKPKAYCGMHARRVRLRGDPGSTDPIQYEGRTLHGDGYILVLCPPEFITMATSTNYVLEHRLVMARHLGRPLEKGEVVHHRNGIKIDNRLENLRLFVRSEHHAGYGDFYQEWQEALHEIKTLRTQLAASHRA